MAYSLHIKRNPPITIDEWLSAVEATDCARIDGSDSVTNNPTTGKEIRIPGSPEAVALWFSELEKWIKVFWFRNGRISFNANDWDNPASPVRTTAFALARQLNAEIIGDEGEVYKQSE